MQKMLDLIGSLHHNYFDHMVLALGIAPAKKFQGLKASFQVI